MTAWMDEVRSTISDLTICDTRVTRTLKSHYLLIRIVCPCISAWLNVLHMSEQESGGPVGDDDCAAYGSTSECKSSEGTTEEVSIDARLSPL